MCVVCDKNISRYMFFLYLLKQNEMKLTYITYMHWKFYNLHTILFIWIEYTTKVSMVYS